MVLFWFLLLLWFFIQDSTEEQPLYVKPQKMLLWFHFSCLRLLLVITGSNLITNGPGQLFENLRSRWYWVRVMVLMVTVIWNTLLLSYIYDVQKALCASCKSSSHYRTRSENGPGFVNISQPADGRSGGFLHIRLLLQGKGFIRSLFVSSLLLPHPSVQVSLFAEILIHVHTPIMMPTEPGE